ncbi:MAG TPA: phage portal protein [Aggregatilinea sp.]|uniref:phage portal protein n=1 Tax=Aggregatilinea sp. TaxID=2806333 RepID=UPI002B830D0C|nr:phage portal protein [Aggregatilinea sp.]HML24946.1 phage portal protein [Aggregatilinea sp.]
MIQSLSRRLFRRRSQPDGRKQAAMMLFPSLGGDPAWHMINLDSYINEGFNLNTLIYSALMWKARAMSLAPLRAYLGTPDERQLAPRDHPLSQLLARPNPFTSRSEFIQAMTVYWNLGGNCYIALKRPSAEALPEAMYLLRPDRVFIVPDDEIGIKGFLFVPEGKSKRDGVPFLPQDMMHIKFPSPGDPMHGLGYGLSPLSPLARSGDVDNAITRYLKVFFERGAMFQGLIKSSLPLNDDEMARIRRRWQEIYGGVDNWGEVGVLDQSGEYQRVASTFEEMGFESLDERNESRILGPFGVAPILIGARVGLKHGTYSNYAQARQATWEDTLVPEQALIADEGQYYLAAPDGAFVDFDRSQVPALRRDVTGLAEAAWKMFQMGVPANVALQTAGLPAPALATGDIGYVPQTMVPVGGADALPAATPAGDNADATSDDRADSKRRAGARHLKAYDRDSMATKMDRLAVDWEERFGDTARACFDQDRRECLALVQEGAKAARQRKASPRWTEIEGDILDYLKEQGATNWREQFIPLMEGIMQESGENWAGALGVQFDIRNLRAEAWFEDYTLVFAQEINDTTKNDVQAIIAQAMSEGWTVSEMEDRLEDLFQQYMDGDLTAADFEWFEQRMPPYRREMIARTETMRSLGVGNHQLFGEWGVTQHEWSATVDGRERPNHRDANGQVRAIDEPFDVGGYKMDHPLDGSHGAPLKEIVNCRCSELPVVED